MRLLAVDTSGPCAGVALLGDETWSRVSLRTRAQHAEVLIPVINDLLARNGWSLNDVDAFAVTVGPGSFTGLRIGLSTVMGLAAGAGKPIIGVPTLEAVAKPWRTGAHAVAACLDARREQLYVQIFDAQAAEPEPKAVAVGEVLGRLTERTLVVGDGSDLLRRRPEASEHPLAFFAPGTLWYDAVEGLAAVAAERWQSGRFGERPAPLYLRAEGASSQPVWGESAT